MLLKKNFVALLALALSSQIFLAPPVRSQDDAVMTALEKELNRSFTKLKSIKDSPVYFLGFRLYDIETISLAAQYGALNAEGTPKHSRILGIDLRVGSPTLDNTHKVRDYIRPNLASLVSQHSSPIPIEDDEMALRNAIWIRTDGAFKDAQKRYSVIKANQDLQTEEEDTSADFSTEKPCIHIDTSANALPVDRQKWEDELRRLSEIYNHYPNILHSRVDFTATKTRRYFVNSEGTKIEDEKLQYHLFTSAETLTQDGMRIWLDDSTELTTLAELPSEEQYAQTIRNLADQLEQLRKAPLAEPYTGPAILNAKAAAVYFHETLGHRVEGNRQKDMDEGRTFAKKLGQQIMPSFISVVDDPTCEHLNAKSLNGHYEIDDEGVPAQKVTVVDHGILKAFLTSRSPIKSFPQSNGHGRCSPGYAPMSRQGNLMVIADKSVPYNDLRAALISEAKKQGKPYGLVFDQISGGFTFTQTAAPQSFKLIPLIVKRIYVDGRPDEMIRGADLVGTPLTSLENIMQASNETDIFNGICGAQSGWVPVSAIAPSLLIKTIEVERKANYQQKPPILPSPLSEKDTSSQKTK